MLLLLTAVNHILSGWRVLQWHDVRTKFSGNQSTCSGIERGETYRQHNDM